MFVVSFSEGLIEEGNRCIASDFEGGVVSIQEYLEQGPLHRRDWLRLSLLFPRFLLESFLFVERFYNLMLELVRCFMETGWHLNHALLGHCSLSRPVGHHLPLIHQS